MLVDISIGQDLSARVRMNVYTCLVAVVLFCATCHAAAATEGTQDSPSPDNDALTTLWNVYLLPKLLQDLDRKYNEQAESDVVRNYGDLTGKVL